MDKVKEQLKTNTAILDPYAAMIPALVNASKAADVNPGLLLAGIGSVGLLILLLMQGWNMLLTTITVLYPTVHSIRAIQSPEDDDDKIWLTYWMVFGIFNVLETFFSFVFYFIPYWDWLRLMLFVWLLLPNFNGAKVLYEGVIRSQLDKHKDLIKKWIDMTSTAASSVKDNAMDQAKAAASDPSLMAKGLNVVNQVQEAVKEDE